MKLYVKEGILCSCAYCNGILLNIVITWMCVCVCVLVSRFDLRSNCGTYVWNLSHLRKILCPMSLEVLNS
jgi:hypothetical protein